MEIETDVLDKRWYRLSSFIKVILHSFKVNGKLFLILNNEEQMRDLHFRTAGKIYATDVLSFVIGYSDMLGEIVLCYDSIQIAAKEEKKSLKEKSAHLAIHGMLHILGYSHDNNEEWKKMKLKEIEIMESMNFQRPYK